MAHSLRILHLEDDPNDAELIKETLTDGELACKITRVETADAFKAVLEREQLDLILSDYNLPTLNGLDALKLATAIKPALPFIFVSGVMGEEFAVLTLQLGATDYVLKKNLARLPAAIRRALNEAEATATRMRMEESLRLHATRMKSIMDTSLDAIIVMDSQGKILDWNAQAEVIFGWRKPEVLGRLVADTIIPPHHREAHAKGLSRFLVTGEGPVLNRRVELTAVHRKGWEFPVELAVTATRIHDKWQFTGFIMDITQRKRAERRLAAQYQVSQALADAQTIQQAAAKILQTLCDCLGWEVGGLWMVDRKANLLRCLDFWHTPHFDAAAFIAENRQWTFAPDVGMPGRVWSRGESLWIADIAREPSLPRSAMAKQAGLHALIGFPITAGRRVHGIIEFFSREVRERDEELMLMVGDIGVKIGQFIERAQADEALRDSERRFKLLVDHANDIIYRTDARGYLTYVNPTATRIMQYSEEELLRMRYVDVIRPDQRRATERFYARHLTDRTASSYYEFPAIRKDGTEVWLGQNVQQLFEDGRTVGFQAVARDITERKQAEEALRQSQELVRATWEHTPLIMFLKDREGRYLDVNPPFLKLTERPREEIVGSTDNELFEQEQAAAFRKNDLTVLALNKPFEFEEVAAHKDGPHTSIVFKFPLRNAAGHAYAVGGIAADITERRQLEELRLGRVAAEEANKAKSEFLSRMSHELRTPLNAVLGFAQLLEMDGLNPDQREHVQQILKGGRHLLALINEVLDIARIEAGRLSLSLEPVPVFAVLGEAADLIRPQAATRKVSLALPSAPDAPVYVHADQQRLKQVLLNLLSNGVKYNRDGGTLTVSGQALPEGRYRMTVTDTGGGIPAAMMSRLFTPFDRLEADHRVEGTGLGLVLSRSLVTAMGGSIFVDSVVGQGTTVSVELPLAGAPSVRTDTPIDQADLPPRPDVPATVLYIEDNQANYQLIQQLVERRPGLRLIGAMQGQLGLELAVAHRPDVILLDLNLPDMQGDEVLAHLRERPETAMIPVVMISADAMQKQIDTLLAAGAQRYLTKPIDVGQFYAVLDELTTKKGGS